MLGRHRPKYKVGIMFGDISILLFLITRRLKQRIVIIIKRGVLIGLTLAFITYGAAWLNKAGRVNDFISPKSLLVVL